ncbi:MAG: succinylglutamate desuccinylase [Rubrivivax sp. SCN 71-131]|jgi:predicted deacylase|nr:MAG: succinylglutamate desuccinylase [Rubrivivax sp. SCN 71-131]
MSDTATPQHLRVHAFHGLRPGPRLLVLGAVHGNEIAGTRGIARILAELDSGALRIARGGVSFVPVTNPLAYALGQRAGERNLNRNLRPSAVPQDFEDRLANVLCPLLDAHDALLDLHSFHGAGEAFVMIGPEDNEGALEPFAHAAKEERLARHLGVRRVVDGWLAVYGSGVARRRARARASGRTLDADPNYGVGTTEYMRARGGWAMTLECGPHGDPQAPEVAYRAIRQTLALLGLAEIELQPPRQDHERLRLVEVVDRLHGDDRFVREWASFDAVRAGEPIAVRHDGQLLAAAADGRIVFPNSRAEPGQEWYYLAQPSARRLA